MEGRQRDIFVISDLHLGDAGVRDNFELNRKTPQLRAFLDHVGGEGGELVILGDLFELWQMNLSLLFVKRRELLDAFVTLPLVYVPGNHDIDLIHFIDTDFLAHPFFTHMRPPFLRELGGKRFRFFHGHETDPFNAGDEPGFGRMLTIFAGIFEDEYGSPLVGTGERVKDVLEQFGDAMLAIWRTAVSTVQTHLGKKKEVRPGSALTPAQNPDRLIEHVAGIRADRENAGYDIAVLGHTHKPGRIGDWYYNSGTWTGRTNSFLRISPEGHVRYFDWREGRAIEHAVPVVAEDAAPERAASVPARSPFAAAGAAAMTLFPRPKKPERSRWILIVQGAIALAVGLYALTISLRAGSYAGWRVLVTTFGVYALLDGLISLRGASREQPLNRLLYRARGAASILLGLVVLRRGYVVEIFELLFGVWALISGAFRAAVAVVFKGMVQSRWLLLVGVGSMIAGLVLLLLPMSAPLLKIALSAYLCYYGVGQVMAGVFGQRLPTEARRATRAAPG